MIDEQERWQKEIFGLTLGARQLLSEIDWSVFNETPAEHDRAFAKVQEPGEQIQQFLIDAQAKGEKIVVVEGMGPGGLILNLNDEIKPDLSVAIDITPQKKLFSQEQLAVLTAEKHFHYVEGNIIRKQTWQNFFEVLGDKKITLFVVRPVGGLSFLPGKSESSLNFYYWMLNRIYQKLAPDGMMLTQSYNVFLPSLQKWEQALEAAGIEVAIDTSGDNENFVVTKIRKMVQSPENLPKLSETDIARLSLKQ